MVDVALFSFKVWEFSVDSPCFCQSVLVGYCYARIFSAWTFSDAEMVESDRKRVVFVVDTSFDKDHNSLNSVVYHFVLKILISLASQRVYWGWNFCSSSSSQSSERRKFDFVEFSLSNFQDFISEFESRCTHDSEAAAVRRTNLSPAQRLTSLLRDVVINFTWDMPDISSPKRQRWPGRKPRGDQLDKQHSCCVRNYVFTLTSCPRDRQEWNDFVKDQPKRDAFLPASIYQQFKSKGIKLFFVDTLFRKVRLTGLFVSWYLL